MDLVLPCWYVLVFFLCNIHYSILSLFLLSSRNLISFFCTVLRHKDKRINFMNIYKKKITCIIHYESNEILSHKIILSKLNYFFKECKKNLISTTIKTIQIHVVFSQYFITFYLLNSFIIIHVCDIYIVQLFYDILNKRPWNYCLCNGVLIDSAKGLKSIFWRHLIWWCYI